MMATLVFVVSLPLWVEILGTGLGIVDAGYVPRRRALALRRFAARLAVATRSDPAGTRGLHEGLVGGRQRPTARHRVAIHSHQ